MTALKMHFDNDYYATIKALPKQKNKSPVRGLILEMPPNFLAETVGHTILYEVDGESVSLYRDKKKIQNIPCPAYAVRPLIIVDVAIRMSESGIHPKVCKMIDAAGKVKNEKYDMVNLIVKPDKETLLLEKSLDERFLDFLYEGIEDNVPKDILSGFKVLMSRYCEGIKA
jgi:hypothetical protein